uniref:Uncharacterized protein n=1 Tax=Arundo donax TaxID=35708 RepID=A0A0A9B8P0_ARUDO
MVTPQSDLVQQGCTASIWNMSSIKKDALHTKHKDTTIVACIKTIWGEATMKAQS